MKKTSVLFILFFIFQTQASSQSCLPNGININTQEEIDNFSTNYPGCTEIGGSVLISDQGTNSITNLNGLNVITSINGYLVIGENNSLTSLSGLENLNLIGGSLEINDNSILSDLTALNNVTIVGGSITIESNDTLLNLTGLNNITSVVESIFIVHNANLTSIDGLENIESIRNYLRISFNSALTNLDGLISVSSIGDYLFINHNDSLISLQGLENVTSINGELRIQFNESLLSLEGIDNISAASIERLRISNNISLSTCEVESICDYIANPTGMIEIGGNSTGCNNEHEIIDACSVGIQRNTEKIFLIYPNPADKIISILHNPNSDLDCVNIYNYFGQNVLTQLNSTGTMDLSKLEQGIYIIEITSSELKTRQKLIIE